MRTLFFDLHDAVRSLRRDYAFTATVVVTLALTLGATTTVFSIVDGILLRPLGYAEPERLVTLHESWREFARRVPTLPVNERHFDYWRANAKSFEALAQYLPLPANLTSGAGDAMQVSVGRTTSELFDVLRVRPALGRALTVLDERPGQPDVAVISDALWRNRLGADEHIVGQAIVLDGKPFTVVGVLPPSFRLPMGEQLVASVDAFVPLHVEVGWVGDHNDVAIGRLRDGVSLDAVRAELNVLQSQVSAIASKEAGEPVTLSAIVTPLAESVVGRARRGLVLLFAAVVAVLLIASSNLANLSLTRALARARDGAIRSALGASQMRLIRRVVLEQLVLALAGAAAGLWVGSVALGLFVRTAPVDLPRLEDVSLDARVMLFAFSVAAVAGLLVSILPAWHLGARDVQAVLRAGGTVVGADRAGLRSRAALLTLQIAISVTLLVVTGLLGVSLMRVLAIDRGFDAEHVVAVPLALPTARYADDRLRIDAYDRILHDVRAIAGVRTLSPTSLLPMRGEGQVNLLVAQGSTVPRAEQPSANFRFIAPEYFQTLRLPLRSGRSFTDAERDASRPAPAVISQSVADRLWPGHDALGKVFSRGIENEQSFEVVGVAIDARTTSLEHAPPLMVYVPYWWRSRASTSLLVRTDNAPTSVVADIRRVIRQIDPEIAVGQARVLEDIVNAATAVRRYQSQLFIVFGLVALFIATLGVYAVTAYSLSKRRREMNIRVALGARTSTVVAMIVRQTGAAVLVGVVLGAVGALIAGGAIASLLYDVSARDPLVLTAVSALVTAAGIAATVIATRQGLSIDPVATLREE
jgi:predicted permease